MATGRYEIKCHDCKREIGRTDSVGESAAGGRCNPCRQLIRDLANIPDQINRILRG